MARAGENGLVRVAILGPFEVHSDAGDWLPVAGARLRDLIIRLALAGGFVLDHRQQRGCACLVVKDEHRGPAPLCPGSQQLFADIVPLGRRAGICHWPVHLASNSRAGA